MVGSFADRPGAGIWFPKLGVPYGGGGGVPHNKGILLCGGGLYSRGRLFSNTPLLALKTLKSDKSLDM